MPTALITGGIACGALLTATGLALRDDLRQTSKFVHAVYAARWLAGALLLVGTLFTWQWNRGIPTPATRLILMAALATLPERHRHYARWGNTLSSLPILILAGVNLLWGPNLARVEIDQANDFLTVVVKLTIAVCGGLGARALSQHFGEFTAPPPHIERPAPSTAATYALLTFLLSSTTLLNLWQQGSVWGKAAYGGGLAGVWVAWSAAWSSPHRPRWLQSALMIAATTLLVVLAC